MNFKTWLLLTEAKKSSDIARELLGNNENLFNQIKSIIPTDIKQDLQAKLLPIAAYYYKQQPNLNTLKQDIFKYAKLVKLNKMPIITVNDDTTINNEFKDYLHWTQIIHGKEAEDKILNAPIPQGNLEDQELIAQSPDGRIKVYKANSLNQCIILGKGESFCISQPANTMFQSYRDTKVSTFYFVYDNTRNDDLSIVVVDATEQGIELTDRKNQTAQTMQDPYSNTPNRIKSDPQLYFKYLQQHGIDTSIFKNISKTKEETAEQQKLGKEEHDLQWFKSLTSEEKSKYIGRGHLLSNEQFDFLYDNKFMLLLTQYVRTGVKLNDYQLEKIIKVRDLKDKYLHNRLIANQHIDDLSKQEYDLLSPKQKEEFFNVDADKKFDKSIQMGELEKLKEAIRDGVKISDDAVWFAARNGHLDIVKYLVKKGAGISNFAVTNAAENGHLDIVKYLVKKDPLIGPFIGQAFTNAAENGHLDIVKYIVEVKGANISSYVAEYALYSATVNGHLDIVKYLLGDEVKDNKGNIIKLPNSVQPAKIKDDAVHGAVNKGLLEILKYLVKKGANIGNTEAVVYKAAVNGYLDILKYLVEEKGARIDYYAINYAKTQEIKDYLIQKQKEQKLNKT